MAKREKNKGKSKSASKNKRGKQKRLKIIIAAVIFAVAVVFSVILIKGCAESSANTNGLVDCAWTPSSAHNASGDEVELSEIYNTYYTTYKGSLTFNTDGTFSLWLSPGDISDGTHTGEYSVKSEDTVEVYFDDGTNTTFELQRKDGAVEGITVNYNDYEIYFTKE